MNYKLGKEDWILILITCIILQCIFLWCIDISVSALINQGYVTNGFFIGDPAKSYHIGLYGSLLNPVVMVFLLVHYVMNKKEMKV